MRLQSYAFILALIFLAPGLSFAQAEKTYGAEFELNHPSITDDWRKGTKGEAQAIQAKLMFVDNLRTLCAGGNCRIIEVEGKYADADFQVLFKDGFWFKVSYDPGTVEITTKPSTLKELRKQKKRMQTYIFDSGKPLGFFIPQDDSAHFNTGFRSAFGTSGEKFLRFFVDYQNHPELAAGLLGHDPDNAPTLAMLSKDQRDQLKILVERLNSDPAGMTAQEVANFINSKIYTASYNKSWGGKKHYQAFGIKYITEALMEKSDRPFELRAIWSQKDMDHFIRLAELIEARIDFNNQQRTVIRYTGTDKQTFTKSEMKTKFYIYVTEAGLDFNKYLRLMPEDIRNASLAPFLDSTLPIETRMKSFEQYRAVLPVSEWMLQFGEGLARESLRQGVRISPEILNAMNRSQELNPVMCHHVF
jgi:hypothetical protein